jgi:hypothetical protein
VRNETAIDAASYPRRMYTSTTLPRKPMTAILIKVGHTVVAGGRYSDSLRAASPGDRIPVGVEILRTFPDGPWDPPSFLYNVYRVSFPGVKQSGCDVDHPPELAPRLKKE